MDKPYLFSALSMFAVFIYRDVSYIKTSHATDTQDGHAMNLLDYSPCKFDKQTEVILIQA